MTRGPQRPRIGSAQGFRPPQKTGSAVSQESNDRAIARLAGLVRRNQPCVVLTGAGISTESGIPDFRSQAGLWADFDPMEYASMEAFRSDPEKVWRFYGPRISMLTGAEPNPAHYALAELERLGFVEAIVTQNIDLLHQRAGSREVVEVHGSIRTSTCPQCGASHSLERVVAMLEERPDEAPRCESCAAVLKPDVVFFGEILPEREIQRAYELARSAALMVAVGSSLEVHPVAALPLQTLDAGGAFAIVNLGSTPIDRQAAVRIDGSAAVVLPAVAKILSQKSDAAP